MGPLSCLEKSGTNYPVMRATIQKDGQAYLQYQVRGSDTDDN
jgi:hypothetical protein